MGVEIAKKRYTPEQIIRKLREAEIELGRGKNVETVCRGLGISPQTYYRWRKAYGGMGVDQAKRLKRLVADQALDIQILKEAAEGNF